MKVCKYCGQSLDQFSNAAGHVANCSLNPVLQITECSFCGQKIVKRSLKNHEIHCKSNPNYEPRKAKLAHKDFYVCKYCNEIFTTPIKFSSHTSQCKLNPINTEKIICKYCQKEFTKHFIIKHEKYCHENSNREKYAIGEKALNELRDDLFCQYCNKQCKNLNSQKQHEIRCKENPDKIFAIKEHSDTGLRRMIQLNKENGPWNKGLTKLNSDSILKGSLTYKKNHALNLHKDLSGNNNPAKRPDVKQKISDSMSKLFADNPSLTHSNAKHGWYKGYWCDSSQELAFVIYCLDHNIPIKRNKEYFSYEVDAVNHKYFPDFYMPDIDVYVEIKGWLSKDEEYKMSFFPKDKVLVILFNEDLYPIFKYVKSRYGDNYINLYENK